MRQNKIHHTLSAWVATRSLGAGRLLPNSLVTFFIITNLLSSVRVTGNPTGVPVDRTKFFSDYFILFYFILFYFFLLINCLSQYVTFTTFLINNHHCHQTPQQRQRTTTTTWTTIMTTMGSSNKEGPDDARCIVWALWYFFFFQ